MAAASNESRCVAVATARKNNVSLRGYAKANLTNQTAIGKRGAARAVLRAIASAIVGDGAPTYVYAMLVRWRARP